ncbi:MAG: hypothetical protein IJR14_02565 [Synergistaceae bacterium]|nr:hypothetical protein [Synergistaceae bacterium]
MATGQDKGKDMVALQELVGAKAELSFSSGLYKGNYASRLEELSTGTGDGAPALLGMAHPMFKGALLPLSRSLELTLRLEGIACFYQSVAEIVRSVVNTDIPLVWIKLTTPLERVQRRAFVRVPCSIKARAYLLEVDTSQEAEAGNGGSPEEALPVPKIWFPLALKDISLGGVGVTVQKEDAPMCRVSGRYLLQMSIDGKEFFIVCGLVKVFKKDEEGRVSAGLAYEGLPAFTEKLMGSFIRQQELNLRGS